MTDHTRSRHVKEGQFGHGQQNTEKPAWFGGMHCVLFALFDAAGRLDRGAMRAQTDLVAGIGVDGITVLGLATEVGKLKVSEQKSIVEWTTRDLAGSVPLSVTLSGSTVEEQRRLAEYSIANGADWLIMQPPPLGGAEECLDFFSSVGEGFDVPLAVQNAPQYLGQSVSGEDIAKLKARNGRFQLVKNETSAVEFADIAAECGGTTLLNGRGGLELTDCLRARCDGFVLAPDAVDHSCLVHDYWLRGEFEVAESAYQYALPAIVFSMQSLDHLICYGKRLFGFRSGISIHDREPALAPSPFGISLARRWAQHLGEFRSRK